MKPITRIWPCIAAALVVSALVASTASAAPKGPYFKVKEGMNAEKVLGVNTGEAEKVTMTARLKAGTKVKLYVPGVRLGVIVECKGARGEGEIFNYYGSPATRMEGRFKKTTVIFEECDLPALPECNVRSAGAVEKEVKLEPFRADLGFAALRGTAAERSMQEKEHEEGKGVELEIIPETLKFTKLEFKGVCGVLPAEAELTSQLIVSIPKPTNELVEIEEVNAEVFEEKQELKEISFIEYNEETNKLELEDISRELKYKTNPVAIEAELQLKAPTGTKVGVYTR